MPCAACEAESDPRAGHVPGQASAHGPGDPGSAASCVSFTEQPNFPWASVQFSSPQDGTSNRVSFPGLL